ncbi:unnamed protein product [Allacma fusca]|uniref:Uncharacterized protein n=1 Tax=Allacma fusca TaxID=39272 RepID=A0A8J2KAB2_9HEXA|nr:unnamed protein product [Allacma fusca]
MAERLVLHYNHFDEELFNDLFTLLLYTAQKLNPKRTEDMIRKSIAWRQDGKIHSDIALEYPQSFIKKYWVLFSKTKDGVPIGYLNAGAMSFKEGVTTLGRILWVKYWVMIIAQLEQQMISYNKIRNREAKQINPGSACGLVVLVDTKNFSSLQLLNADDSFLQEPKAVYFLAGAKPI